MDIQLLKEFTNVSIKKNLPKVDEASGLVSYKSANSISLKSGSKITKSGFSSLTPDDSDMVLINKYALEPQDSKDWIVIRQVRPFGSRGVDIQGDKFSKEFEQHWVNDVNNEPTPILMDHNHDMAGVPPVGIAIRASMGSDGPLEDWAIPLEDHHKAIISGLKKGTVRHTSIGVLVDPANKMCSSCNQSIYAYSCQHEPNQLDERGNIVHVNIKDYVRLLERSLVNVPARVGTSIGSQKSLDDDFMDEFEDIATVTGEPSNTSPLSGDDRELEPTPAMNADPDQVDPDYHVFDKEVKSFMEGLVKLTPGKSNYADPGYQEDGKPRYPCDTPERTKSAWSYINQKADAAKYTPSQLAKVKAKIKAAYRHHFGHDPESASDKSITPATITFVTEPTIKDSVTVAKSEKQIAEPTMVAQNHGDADPKKYEEITNPGSPDYAAEEKAATEEDDECMKSAEDKQDQVDKAAKKEPDGDEGVGGKDKDGDDDTQKDLSNVVSEDPTRARLGNKDLSNVVAEDPTSLKTEKTLKVEAAISKDTDLTIKSLVKSNTEVLEKFNKVAKTVDQQNSIITKQQEMLESLAKMVQDTAEMVKNASTTSADEMMLKMVELFNEAAALKSTKPETVNKSAKADLSDLISQLGQ